MFICDPFFWCLNPVFSLSLVPQWYQRCFVVCEPFPVTCGKLVVHQGSTRWKASNTKCSITVNISVAFCYGRLSGLSVCFLDTCGGSADAGYLSLRQDDSSSRWLTGVWSVGLTIHPLSGAEKLNIVVWRVRHTSILLWKSDFAAFVIFVLIKRVSYCAA